MLSGTRPKKNFNKSIYQSNRSTAEETSGVVKSRSLVQELGGRCTQHVEEKSCYLKEEEKRQFCFLRIYIYSEIKKKRPGCHSGLMNTFRKWYKCLLRLKNDINPTFSCF